MAKAAAAIVSMVCGMLAISAGSVNAQYAQRAILPANSELKLKDAAITFLALELNDGWVVYFDPAIKLAHLTWKVHNRSHPKTDFIPGTSKAADPATTEQRPSCSEKE